MIKVKPNTTVRRVGYKTKDGFGLGVFYMDNEVILDETVGMEVEPQFHESIGRADGFGAIKTKFGWTKKERK